MRKHLGTYRRWLILLLVGPGLVFGSYLGYLYEQGNFHTVAPDRMYRSRQLDKAELIPYIHHDLPVQEYVNLRGENPGSDRCGK